MNKLQHIAFIMDGNGRWGKKKNRGRNYGHLKGLETVKKVVTNLAVIDIVNNEFVLKERAPGVTVQEIISATEGDLVVPEDIPEMNF